MRPRVKQIQPFTAILAAFLLSSCANEGRIYTTEERAMLAQEADAVFEATMHEVVPDRRAEPMGLYRDADEMKSNLHYRVLFSVGKMIKGDLIRAKERREGPGPFEVLVADPGKTFYFFPRGVSRFNFSRRGGGARRASALADQMNPVAEPRFTLYLKFAPTPYREFQLLGAERILPEKPEKDRGAI